MSRLGKIAVSVPNGVEIKKEGAKLHVKGPKGTLTSEFPEALSIKVESGEALVIREDEKSLSNALYGLYRALFNNMVIGVSKGFQENLTMVGVGYRAFVEGHVLNLQIGKSHPTKVEIPKEIIVTVDAKSGVINIAGINKHLVGQFAAQVRGKKPPEPYKGKGIRYENEFVRKKAGKAAKAKTAG
jgi:large subunit ribosomal protein L6